MPTYRPTCPDELTLRKFLSEELAAGEAAWVDEHVTDCQACQETLERVVGSVPETPPRSDKRQRDKRPNARRLDEFEPGGRIDDFDLLCRLGRGSFASVFLARQRSLERLVALKISRDQGSEPQTLARLDHPLIVRVYDQQPLPERGLRLLYMQYVPGGTLQQAIEHMRPTPPEARSGKTLLAAIDAALARRGETAPADSATRAMLAQASWPALVAWLGARLAEALDYAHRAGVLHRDVKPANILLAADGTPLLADFNISFNSKLEGTAAEQFGGTRPYMSPEHLEAFHPDYPRLPDSLDGRADLYSLGVGLWELLTGSLPFAEPSSSEGYAAALDETIRRRREGVPAESLAQLPRNLAAGLDQVLLTALAPEADERQATAGQMAQQLELCLHPRAQRLLNPRRGGWTDWLRQHALAALVLVGLVPNLAATALNIAYNRVAIVEPADRRFFELQILIVNAVAYPIGVGVLLTLTTPLAQTAKRMLHGGRVTGSGRGQARPYSVLPQRILAHRRRSLWLGDCAAWISLGLWIATGIVFPTWLHAVGASGDMGTLYLHFLVSTSLCGLIAGTLSFFPITFLSLRALATPMLRAEPGDAAVSLPLNTSDSAILERLGHRIPHFLGAARAVPIVAIILLVLINSRLRMVILLMACVALLAGFVATRLGQATLADLDALQKGGVA